MPSLFKLDEETIRRYALTIGDDNPLYTDPDYGRTSPYGSQLAPGPVLVHCRYPADHGAERPNGYPVANFLGGVTWEFFDVIRPGVAVNSSKMLREVLRPRGLRSELILLVSETRYFDNSGDLLAKAYGTLVQLPMAGMASSRSMAVEDVDDNRIYDTGQYRYSPTEVRELERLMLSEKRRGAEPLCWEDVAVGDELPAIAQPPYSLADSQSYQSLHQGLVRGYGGGHLARAFAPGFEALKAGWGYPDYARTHPITRWPYTPGDEHEDAYICRFRGQPMPFDFGIQRAQIPQRLLGNWAGDSGFCRKLSISMSRPVFHGDALIFRGQVIEKKAVEEGDGRPCRKAVVIAITGTSQRGETVSRGYATQYLPSRDDGLPSLPVRPIGTPYVPHSKHRSREWH